MSEHNQSDTTPRGGWTALSCGVTGASGFVGHHLIAELEMRGCRIVRLDRTAGAAVHAGQVSVLGDIRDERALDNLVAQTDAVIHLAAYVHREAISEPDIRECFAVNVEGTWQLIRAIEGHGCRQHVIFISTVAVYGAQFSRAREDAPCQPATPYAQSKREAEKLIMEAIRRGNITGSVLRPAMVVGPDAPGHLAKLMRLMRRGVFPLVRDGQNAKSLVYVKDLVAVILRCLAHRAETNGKVYNVAAGPPLTVRQIGDALARGLGRSPIYVPVDGWAAAAAAGMSHLASRLSGRRLPDLSRTIQAFAATTTVDASAIEKDLDFQFRPTEAALEEVARHFRGTDPQAESTS